MINMLAETKKSEQTILSQKIEIKNINKNIENKNFESKTDSDSDRLLTSCGIGSWRPVWLQVLNNPLYFLINICIIGVIQSMAGSMIYSTMNSIEKRYAFDSKVSAIIFIADNICSIFVS